MVGPSRPIVLALFLGTALTAGPGLADEPKPQSPAPATRPADGPAPAKPEPRPTPRPSPADFALPGEDAPAPFVPKTPRTVADQKKVESLRLYTEARALEARGQLREAIELLEKALAGDPDSIPILRRLVALNEPLGRFDKAAEFARRVVAAEPDDARTVAFLVKYYRSRKRDAGKAEAVLREVLANPKLDKSSPGAIVIQFELAGLYESQRQFDKAAGPLAAVVDALDDKAARQLPPADQRRILGDNPAGSYLSFARIFSLAGRPELALRSLQRAAVYDDDNPLVSLFLAEAYLNLGRGDDALATLDKVFKAVPPAPSFLRSLSAILGRLGRDAEVIPRLEAAAKADPKNPGLKQLLIERYRQAGRADKAEAVARAMLQDRPDFQGFAALFAQLMGQKKSGDLLVLLERTAEQLGRVDALGIQLDALAADPAYAAAVVDAGLAMLKSDPPRLGRGGWQVLLAIATRAKKPEKVVDLLRWEVGERPDPFAYRNLASELLELNRFDEAEAAFEDLMAKFPAERNPQTLLQLCQVRIAAHKEDAAIVVLRDLLKKSPNDPTATRMLAFALSQKGSGDEAIALLLDALKGSPADIDLIRSLGGVFQQTGKNAEAIAFFKSLVEKYPNNDEVIKYARSFLSTLYTGQGDFAKGEAELELLFAKDPNDVGVNNDLGYLYAEQGKNLEKAEGMIRKAVAEEPDNSAYLDSLGWVLFKRGKARDAIAPLEKAIEKLNFPDATIHEHLGDVFFELKDRPRAKAAWEKAEKIAAESKPPDKHLGEIRKKLDTLKKLEPSSSPGAGANP